MAASTAFNSDALIPMAEGGGFTVFNYVSTDARTTLADTSVGSYFSSAWARFSTSGTTGPDDVINVLTSTGGYFPLAVFAASSTGVTVGTIVASTGAVL